MRPLLGAVVSIPLAWDEVKAGLIVGHYNIHNAFSLLKDTGNMFKWVLGTGIDWRKRLRKRKVFK